MSSDLNVILLSGDPKLSDSNSAVSKRLATYGSMANKLFIVASASGQDHQIAENVFVYPIGRGLPFFRSRSFVKKAKEIIKVNALNSTNTIISAQDPFDIGKAGVILKNKFNLPLEIQIHGDIMSPWFKKQSFLNAYRVTKAPNILKQADKVRVVSNAIAESISSIVASEKIYVLPVPIDPNVPQGDSHYLKQKYPGFGFTMLMVARLEPEKGLGEAFELVRQLIPIEPKIGLIVVGDGGERSRLENLARKLRIREHMSFEGWQNDMTPYYQSADLFLQTSFFEGYGMAVAEAALYSRAILSTDVGLAHDLAKLDAAVVVPVGDRGALFEQTKKLLDQQKRILMGIAAQRVINSLVVSKAKYLQKQSEVWHGMLDK